MDEKNISDVHPIPCTQFKHIEFRQSLWSANIFPSTKIKKGGKKRKKKKKSIK